MTRSRKGDKSLPPKSDGLNTAAPLTTLPARTLKGCTLANEQITPPLVHSWRNIWIAFWRRSVLLFCLPRHYQGSRFLRAFRLSGRGNSTSRNRRLMVRHLGAKSWLSKQRAKVSGSLLRMLTQRAIQRRQSSSTSALGSSTL